MNSYSDTNLPKFIGKKKYRKIHIQLNPFSNSNSNSNSSKNQKKNKYPIQENEKEKEKEKKEDFPKKENLTQNNQPVKKLLKEPKLKEYEINLICDLTNPEIKKLFNKTVK